MTPDDIKRLRALCEQATQPGPWTVNVNDIGKDGDGHCVVLDAHGMWVADCGNAPADAAFIAAARSALPAALDEVERLRKERDAHRTDAENLHREGGPARRELRLLKVVHERVIAERDAATEVIANTLFYMERSGLMANVAPSLVEQWKSPHSPATDKEE